MSLRVGYFGSYDPAGRNRILIDGLEAVGATVVEHRATVWPSTEAKLHAASRGLSLVRGLVRHARAWARLGTRLPAPVDILVVGATAHLDLPLAWVAARRAGVPLVFDPLVSASETIRDRGLRAPRSPALAVVVAAERALFRMADVVVADTARHGRAYVDELGVPAEKVRVVPAGAPGLFRQTPPLELTAVARVAYFGQYIPLHGLDVVVAAADRLRSSSGDIGFVLAGVGQEYDTIRSRVRETALDNVRFDPRWMPPEALRDLHVAPATVCLGVFGDVPKADRVVPFKVYTAMAAGRPVVTADTAAVRELLRPDEVVTVPPGDPRALAEAVRAVVDQPAWAHQLGARAQTGFADRFGPEALGRRWTGVLAEAVTRRAAGHGSAARPPVRPSP